MPTDQERLEHFLATAGSSTTRRDGVERRLAATIYERELGRQPDASFDPPRLESEEDVAAFVASVRASPEWWTTNHPTHGSHTHAFRVLSAHLSASGRTVAPQVVAECVVAYRLLLGRDPDVGGLEQFVAQRETDGLVPVLRVFIGSAEIRTHLDDAELPPIGIVTMLVSASAMSLLAAVAGDTALGVALATRSSVDHLVRKLDEVVSALQGLTTLCELRFDGARP